MNTSQRFLFIAGGVFFAAYIAVLLFQTASQIDLRDYKTYYYATQAFMAGDNPYALEVLSRHADADIRYPFLYPKYLLVAFVPLALFEYQTSALLYIGVKAVAMLVLVFLWYRYYVSDLFYGLLLSVFLVSAYQGAILRDFVVGNISVFEQLLLWSAFLALFRNQMRWFYLLIVLAALFKTVTCVFLLLPLFFMRDKRTVWSIVVSLAVVVMFSLLSYWGNFALMSERFAQLRWDGSIYNPSSFAVLKDALLSLGVESFVVMNYATVLHAIYVVAIGIVAFFALKKEERWKNPSIVLLAGIFLYALLLPRFTYYSYILLVVPSLIVLRDMVHSTVLKVAVVLLVCVHVLEYQSFFAAAALFVCFLAGLQQLPKTYSILRNKMVTI